MAGSGEAWVVLSAECVLEGDSSDRRNDSSHWARTSSWLPLGSLSLGAEIVLPKD